MKNRIGSTAKNVRDKMGLTQLELALYLKVRPSTIAMNEVGERELPPEASLKLTYMHLSLLKEPATIEKVANEADTKIVADKMIEKLKHYRLGLQIKLWRLQKKIQKLQQAYEQAMNLTHWINLEKQKENLDAHDKHWIEITEPAARGSFNWNSEAAQLLQRLQLYGLEQQIAESARMIVELGGEVEKEK